MPRETHTILASHLAQIGDRSVHIVTKQGSFANGINKDGSDAILHYAAGSFILRDDKRDYVLVGPTDRQGAVDLATAIIHGNHRAVTEPQALLVMAMCVIALAEILPVPVEPAAAATEAV